MNDQLHLGMNVAVHLKGAHARKAFGKIFTWGPFLGIEQADREDLVDEFVIVGEGEGFAAIDRHFNRMKGSAALDDGMSRIGRENRTADEQENKNRPAFFHRVKTSC
jgi:hypothetical protein